MTDVLSILVIDDDPDVQMAARLALQPLGYPVQTLSEPDGAAEMAASMTTGAVLLDLNFTVGASQGDEGLDLLDLLQKIDPTLSVVLMTAFGRVSLAVEALKRGATDFVMKPWQNEKLQATMAAALSLTEARRKAEDLQARNRALASQISVPNSEIVGTSPALLKVFNVIDRAAPTDANILLLGESGTGKEVMARDIHRRSRRADRPFISVDLGTISESLFESELFGHRKGAFTGAIGDRVGRIETADGGTLFLDEIGNLPMHLQGKLLTFLERREFVPVGASKPVSVDVRLICATNRSAAQLGREEVFRQDLLFRIKTVTIVLPPLRERRQDIGPLLEHYLTVYARKHNVERRRMTPDLMTQLEDYPWPGNVRELRHAAESATVLASSIKLEPQDFPLLSGDRPNLPDHAPLYNLEQVERDTVRRALIVFEGNISLAAQALGLTRPALYRRIAKHGL